MARHTIALRPVAYQKLKDLTEEISRKRGYHISMAQVVEASIEFLDRLESMEDETDVAAFHGESEGK